MKEYEVEINGLKHTLLLTAEDAASYGDAVVEVKQATKPANKSRTTDTK
jgi:hypothetical protein